MQSILPEEFAELVEEVRQIAAVLHREVNWRLLALLCAHLFVTDEQTLTDTACG